MDRRALLGLAAVAAASASPAVASSGKSGGGAPADSYIRLPVVTASVMRANGQRGVLSVETGAMPLLLVMLGCGVLALAALIFLRRSDEA